MSDDHVRAAIETLEWGTVGHCLICREFIRAYVPDVGVKPGTHKPDCLIRLAIEQLKADGRWRKWEFR